MKFNARRKTILDYSYLRVTYVDGAYYVFIRNQSYLGINEKDFDKLPENIVSILNKDSKKIISLRYRLQESELIDHNQYVWLEVENGSAKDLEEIQEKIETIIEEKEKNHEEQQQQNISYF
jgi:hypothetical protein